MAHVSDAEGFAFHLPEPGSEDDTAFAGAVLLQQPWIITLGHKDGRYRIRTLARFCNIELDHPSLLPHLNGASHRLRQQAVA